MNSSCEVLILRKLHDRSYATSTIRMCYYRYIFHVDSEKSLFDQLRAKGHNQVSHTPMGGQKETVDRKANQTEPKCWFLRFSVGGSFFIFIKFGVSFVTRFLFSMNRWRRTNREFMRSADYLPDLPK